MFPTNEGSLDRILRICGGIILLVLALRGQYTPWTWLGVVPLLTGLIGWCPAYSLFGVRTCKLR